MTALKKTAANFPEENRVKEIQDVPPYSMKMNNVNNKDFKTLSTLLNQTLDFLINRDNNDKDHTKPQEVVIPHKEVIIPEPELINVNILNNVGGKLRLTGKKPMLKETFQKIRIEQNK